MAEGVIGDSKEGSLFDFVYTAAISVECGLHTSANFPEPDLNSSV
jgi:hypothetical protein